LNPVANIAGGDAGPGGYSQGGAYTGSVTTNVNCTFSGNVAGGGAGGHGGNSTIAPGGKGGSGSDGNAGGAIFDYEGAFICCTIVSNSAFAGAAGPGGSGLPNGPNGTPPGKGSAGGVSAYIYAGCANLMFDTILADNYADTSYSNYYCAWTDEGYNFVGSTDYLECAFAPTTQIGTIPAPIHSQLAPLAQNGGGLPTHKATLAGPVIDKGYSFGVTTDERGAPRPYSFGYPRPPGGDGADIGAFERASTDLGQGVNSNNIVLTWAAYYGDFVVQYTTNLQGTSNWNYLRATPVQIGSQLVVTNPMTNALMFYRLASP
jgi:hypothetical protein